jgi:hypothetical protein
MGKWLIGVLLLVCGCSADGNKENLAKCQIRALGNEGQTFRRNYAEGEFVPTGKDGSYREFLITCMEAEGYEFSAPFSESHDLCWLPDSHGLLPDANVDEPRCYDSPWW